MKKCPIIGKKRFVIFLKLLETILSLLGLIHMGASFPFTGPVTLLKQYYCRCSLQ